MKKALQSLCSLALVFFAQFGISKAEATDHSDSLLLQELQAKANPDTLSLDTEISAAEHKN